MADQESIDELIERLERELEDARQHSHWTDSFYRVFREECGKAFPRLRDEIKNLYASNNRIGAKLRKCREENEHLRAVVQEELTHHRLKHGLPRTYEALDEYHEQRADLLERALKGES